MQIYHERDADLELIRGRRVAIIGYGNQGHAHALNLRDSGVADIVVGARQGSVSGGRATADGFRVLPTAEACAAADLVMLLAPDEAQARIYADEIAPNLPQNAALAFAHGLAVHFGLITPRPDLDVFLVAPKGPGRAVRSAYVRGSGLPCLFAVAQEGQANGNGSAKALALAYATAIGAGRAAMLETSFREECETDLFGEQAVLCGGISNLVMAGYETLVAAGYPPEMAYFECVHEAKLITDLMYERGIARMREAISNTAEFGDYVTGPRLIDDHVREQMRGVLQDIQSGRFAQRLMLDTQVGGPQMHAARQRQRAHPIEAVGQKVRSMIPDLRDEAS